MQKMKRLLCLCLAFSLAGLLTGCRRNVGNTASAVESNYNDTLSSTMPDTSPGTSSTPPAGSAQNGSLEEMYEHLKSTYGEAYYPDRRLDAAGLTETFGISEELYDEFIAEVSQDNQKPDALVIVKAKEGKEQQVEDKLNAYRRKLLEDTQWEGSKEKIEASRVYRNGSYVFYVMLGEAGDNTLSGEGLMEALGKEIDRGIDAIEDFFERMM